MPGEFEAVVQRAALDLSEVGLSPNIDRVRLAVIDACTQHEADHFPFMEVRFELQTVKDKYLYGRSDGVPEELAYIDQDLEIDIGGSSSNRHPVTRKSPDYLELLREGSAYSSWPTHWTYWGEQLELWPTPDAAHTIRFRGIKKPPRPQYRWDPAAAAFKFFGSMVSEWFEDQQEIMIRKFAEWLILSGVERDGNSAQLAMAQYNTARASLVQLTEEIDSIGEVDPYPDDLG